MIELMKAKSTFAQSEIQDGDIICFQVELSEKECVPTIPVPSLPFPFPFQIAYSFIFD